MMPEPGSAARWSASQASRGAVEGSVEHAQAQRFAVEGTAQHEHVGRAAELEHLGHVGHHPGVGGRGRGQHRDAGRQLGQQGAQPAEVGPEVVAPVADAVRLVDDEQAAGRRQLRHDVVAEVGVVEPLGREQQHVDLARG